DVEQAKQTALAAYEILRCYCLRHQLDLLDICFFMNEDGDTICAEVSTDNVRLKYLGEDPEIAGLLNSRDKERATERAEAVLQLLRTPFLKHSRFVVSGGFCAGKTSLIRLLQDTMGIPKLIDHSTRDMRPGEREGFPYHFLTRQEFEAALDKGAYYEWVEFNGNYYGVPREIVFEGEAWALDILSASAKDYKGKVPGVFSIFIESPAEEVIIARARARGDSEEKIRERLVYARAESSEGFDLVLPANSTLEQKLALVSQAINE
ncbi:MAG: hypothetical protein KDK78_05270, partial [Chlamydiia bacterium]|nr:hypothetical protein [Chlamydiia bacterium]